MNKMMKNTVNSLLAMAMVLLTMPAQSVELVTYYHNDALGSPVAATDEQGNQLWAEHYQPYGERIVQDAKAGGNPIWYTGKPQDDNTGLSYFGARYYDPVIGRFMGIDPVGFQEANVHSFNRYAYANNNPYKFVDPDGRNAVTAFGGLLYESGQFVTGNGFNGGMVWGALKDGYNGEGSGFAAAAGEDVLSFAGGVLGAGAKLYKLRMLAKAPKSGVNKLDDALAQYNKNDIHHLFGRGGDTPTILLDRFGSPEAALKELQKSAQSIANKYYQTGSWVSVKVGDIPVSIQGKVINGNFRISSIAKREF